MGQKVVLDTNFLMMPFNFKIDVFHELRGYELVTLAECVDELKRIKPSAVELISGKVSLVRESFKSHDVDDKIIEFAVKHNAYIATSDKKLKEKAEAKGVPIVSMRRKKYLVMPDV